MTDRKKTAPPLEAFGVLVRETRLARRLTQQHAARGAGVSRKQWALLEQGQNVSAVFMQKVATYLELSVIPIGEGLRATTESGGRVDVVALFNLADELLSFANTLAERLHALATEAVLPVSERTENAQAIAAFVEETQEPGVASAWLASELETGRIYGPLLLAMPTDRWRSEMNGDENLRRYGTLRFLVEAIRADLFQYPRQARERAAVVVEYVEEVDAPSSHFYYFLGGLAWKEYANALRYTGEFPLALDAAQRSRAIFESAGSLATDAAKARLVEALVHRELGKLDAVLAIARECSAVFRDYGDAEGYMHARMTEALVLSDSKRFKEAMEVLAEAGQDAEIRGDTRTLAICLHNSADCARALGDRNTARRLDALALAHFEHLGTTVEKPMIRWNEAKALADEGRVEAAILELNVTRAEFLGLGMNGSAADCGLDIVRLRFDRGEDITAECTELVETLTKAGMIQAAIEALAYLREQARKRTVSPEKIAAVQEFVRETVSGPARMFVPPPERGA